MNSVVIRSVDAARVRQCADEYANRLLNEHPEIEEIIVFGSFANNTYAPGSDLDVFIVLEHATLPVRDRVPLFLPEKSGSGRCVPFYTSRDGNLGLFSPARRDQEKRVALFAITQVVPLPRSNRNPHSCSDSKA